jgi:hypothetical protein
MGPKGLNVLAITHEPREQVLKYLAQGNPSPMTYTIGLQGGHSLPNPPNGIPYSWLIDVDGKVVWQGHGLPGNKDIQAELKKVKMDAERKAARAQKALEYAEGLVAEKQLVRGLRMLEDVKKEFKGSEAAKKAQERIGEIEKDESLKDELAAQKTLDRLVTGLEQPKEKLKGKERDLIAVKLERFIKEHEAKAPVAVEIAKMWVKVMTEHWSKTA